MSDEPIGPSSSPGGGDLLNTAYAQHREGNLDGAVMSYRLALEKLALEGLAGSRHAYTAHLSLARAFSDARRPDDAESACREALGLRPGEPNGLAILAMILVDQRRLDEAAAAVEQALRTGPAPIEMHNLATAVALRRGLGAAARDLAAGVLQRDRFNPRALCDLALAAVLENDTDTIASLLDLQALVGVMTPSPPAGYTTLETFNDDLALAVAQSAALDRSGGVKTMHEGARLHDAFALPSALASALRTMLTELAESYARELQADHDHPTRAGRPDRLRLTAWANVLEAGGHERPHIHETGWVSGVYYVEMPGPDRSAPDAGALVLGGHHFGDDLPLQGPTRTLLPRPGQAVLFPSYLCHHSQPFSAAGRRISIAFDIHRDLAVRKPQP